MTLARDRAIGEAFLLAGDEDLREGVKEAQDQGVRVTLIGVSPKPGTRNQSQELVYESDDVVVLDREDICQYFGVLRAPSQPTGTRVDLFDVGRRFASQWIESANSHEIRTLLENRPRIPSLIDTELIQVGEQALGVSFQGDQQARHELRSAFGSRVSEHVENE